MSNQDQPTGIIPPLTTPFTPDGKVDEAALRGLVEFQLRKGVHGLFICGTYGSGPLMSLADRQRVHEIVVDVAKGKATVIAHVGAASTADTVALARHAEHAGADCVAAVPPYYHHHDERSVLRHFTALVDAVDLPAYVYNNPKASGFTVTPQTLRRLADAGIAGIKDSGFSYIDFTHLVLEMQDRTDFRFIVGTEGIALAAWMAGAKGCVSGLANAFPEIMVLLWNLYTEGKYEKAAKLQLKVNRARQVLHIPASTNAAIYHVLSSRGIDAGVPKAPILPVDEKSGQAMIDAFRELGFMELKP